MTIYSQYDNIVSIRIFDPGGSAVRLVALAVEREGDLAMPFIKSHAPTPMPDAFNAVAPTIDWLLTEGRNAAGVKGVLDGFGPVSCRTGPPFLEIMLGSLVEIHVAGA